MITIANPRAEKAARRLAKTLDTTISEAVAVACERLLDENDQAARAKRRRAQLDRELAEIWKRHELPQDEAERARLADHVEILTRGPQAGSLRQAMDEAERVFVSSVTRVEAAFVLMDRFGWSRAEFDRGWSTLGLADAAVDGALANSAIDAFESWGRGRAKAALNFGDCFSYALAVTRDVPLLYVGDDFSRTDLRRPGGS